MRRSESVALNELSEAFVAQGDVARALAAAERSRAIMLELVASNPDNTKWQRDLSISHDRLGEVLLLAGRRQDGQIVKRLFSRTGEDISASFPDLVESFAFEGALDGELLIMRDGRVQSFNVLQQRLNRKTVTAKLMAEFPAHLRAYDLLVDGAADLRG